MVRDKQSKSISKFSPDTIGNANESEEISKLFKEILYYSAPTSDEELNSLRDTINDDILATYHDTIVTPAIIIIVSIN